MWRFFPKQKESLYVKSIKNILPKNKFYRSDNININDFNYILPNMDFFGVLFNRVKDGFVEFRYIGGKDYEYKITEALDLIGIYNSFLSKCLFMPGYTDKNKKDLKKIIKSADRILKGYDSYEHFSEQYPKIKFTGYLIEKYEVLPDESVDFLGRLFIQGHNSTSAIDNNVRYGAAYFYKIRTVCLIETIASSENRNDSSLNQNVIAKMLMASEGTLATVTCVENVPPPPPVSMRATFDFETIKPRIMNHLRCLRNMILIIQ